MWAVYKLEGWVEKKKKTQVVNWLHVIYMLVWLVFSLEIEPLNGLSADGKSRVVSTTRSINICTGIWFSLSLLSFSFRLFGGTPQISSKIIHTRVSAVNVCECVSPNVVEICTVQRICTLFKERYTINQQFHWLIPFISLIRSFVRSVGSLTWTFIICNEYIGSVTKHLWRRVKSLPSVCFLFGIVWRSSHARFSMLCNGKCECSRLKFMTLVCSFHSKKQQEEKEEKKSMRT